MGTRNLQHTANRLALGRAFKISELRKTWQATKLRKQVELSRKPSCQGWSSRNWIRLEVDLLQHSKVMKEGALSQYGHLRSRKLQITRWLKNQYLKMIDGAILWEFTQTMHIWPHIETFLKKNANLIRLSSTTFMWANIETCLLIRLREWV